MSRRFLILLILHLCSCSYNPKEPQLLYEEFMNQKPSTNISKLKGDGKLALPNYMSWGIFYYTCKQVYIDSLLIFNNYFEDNEFNKPFEKNKEKYFPNDLSYWTENSKNKFRTEFKRQNCIYLNGIIFPYIHDLLIDTTNYEVLHLVSAMRY